MKGTRHQSLQAPIRGRRRPFTRMRPQSSERRLTPLKGSTPGILLKPRDAAPGGTLDVRRQACTGCRACEVACASVKEGAIHPAASRIHVLQVGPGPLDIPVVCHQCSDAPCVAACPPRIGALAQAGGAGVVTLDRERCVRSRGGRCERCAQACPGATVRFHPVDRLPMFCDLCEGEPACARSCAFEALSWRAGSSFDGRHYARPPEELARDLAIGFYGGSDAD